MGTIAIMMIFNYMIINTPNGIDIFYEYEELNIPKEQMITVYIVSQAITIVVILLFLFLFYYLLYGILLKKLNRNYKELTKLEES